MLFATFPHLFASHHHSKSLPDILFSSFPHLFASHHYSKSLPDNIFYISTFICLTPLLLHFHIYLPLTQPPDIILYIYTFICLSQLFQNRKRSTYVILFSARNSKLPNVIFFYANSQLIIPQSTAWSADSLARTFSVCDGYGISLHMPYNHSTFLPTKRPLHLGHANPVLLLLGSGLRVFRSQAHFLPSLGNTKHPFLRFQYLQVCYLFSYLFLHSYS